MQTVTPLSSAWALTLFKKATQLSAPSWSGHALAVAGKCDDVGRARGRGFVDGGAHGLLDSIVIFLAIERVWNSTAGARRIHRRSEAVLLEQGPIGRANQVETRDTQAGGLAAAIFHAHTSGEDAAGDALPDAPLARDG